MFLRGDVVLPGSKKEQGTRLDCGFARAGKQLLGHSPRTYAPTLGMSGSLSPILLTPSGSRGVDANL